MDADTIADEEPVTDAEGNVLVKIVISSDDGNSGIAYVLPNDAQRILNGELDVTYDQNNQIILLPRLQTSEVNAVEMEEHAPEDMETSKREVMANSSHGYQHSYQSVNDRSSASAYWRPTVLQDEHINDIKRCCESFCAKNNLIEQHRSRKDMLLENYNSGKYSTQPAGYHEMISLLDFRPEEAVEGSERFGLLRKHAMVFRVGPNSKVLTMQEQAVNEAAVQICCICPSLIFQKRELTIHAKQALREAEQDFTGTRPSGYNFSSSAMNAGLESNETTSSGIGAVGGGHVAGTGHQELGSHLLNLPARSASSGITSRPGIDDGVRSGPGGAKYVLSSSDINAIRQAALRLLPEIPDLKIKPREECTLVENYVLSDATKLLQLDEESLDQQMDAIREVASVHGRYNSGPINPSATLSQFEVAVNEASAWLVREKPQLLSHFTVLQDWAKRVALKSGVPTSNSTMGSAGAAGSAAHAGRNLAAKSTGLRGRSSAAADLYGASQADSLRYRLQSGVSAASGDPFYASDYGVGNDYLQSTNGNDGMLGNDDLQQFIRGQDVTGDMHHGMLEYGTAGRTDVDYMEESMLNMSCEEDEKVLDADEILRLTGCQKLCDVRSIQAPCLGFTRIDVADLSECIQLRELNLEENSLRFFPPRLHLPRLTKLGLCGNRFTQIPLVEQFPRLRHLTVDSKFNQRYDLRLLAFFCPHLKTINGEHFLSNVPDFTLRVIQDDYATFEPNIRSKWESEYSERFNSAKSRDERIAVLEELVRELKRKRPIDDNIDSHKDLLLLRFVDEYVRVKLGDKDFEILLGGPLSSSKSSAQSQVTSNVDANGQAPPTVLEEDNEVERENRTEEQHMDGERALFSTAEEMLGYHLQGDVHGLVPGDALVNYLDSDMPSMYAGQVAPGSPGGTGAQFAPPQIHIGRSLRQGRSIVMSLVQPKTIKGKPNAEFLPGELRNKDYVKGHVASEIYKKAVKDQLGLKFPSKKQVTVGMGRGGRGNGMRLPSGKMPNIPGAMMTPLHELSANQSMISVDQTNRKRGRPSGGGGGGGKGMEMSGDDPYMTGDYMSSSSVPARPRIRRHGGVQRSLKDLCAPPGGASDHWAIDYDPLHFIRCHARENDTRDYETKVWRCAFEPHPNNPDETTHIVATCGGECVCLINCETGKVMKRFKHADEEFTCLAWTTVESETGQKTNLLAAAGRLQDIRLLHPEQLMCYAEMKGHTDDVTAMFFHQTNPTILFSGDSKAAILVWDIGVPQGAGGQEYKTRHSLMMRLRCPRLDVNPVLNLVFMPHYDYLIAGCEDGMFAWKLSEFRSEKREKEPDMELRVHTENEINLDGLAQLSDNALVIKGIERGYIQVFDFASVLERRKGLQKLVPVELRGRLEWAQTEEIYISVSVRQSMGAVLCGDHMGSIWIYDLDPHLQELQSNSRQRFEVKPIKILEWPECSMYGAEEGHDMDGRGVGHGNTAGGFSGHGNGELMDSFTHQQNTGFRNPVINAVDMSSDGHFVVAVTDNNLVCIWRYSPQMPGAASGGGGPGSSSLPMGSAPQTADDMDTSMPFM